MEKAYKGVMGYSVWKDGDKHDPTHLVLSYEEYDDLLKRIKAASIKAENAVKMQYQAEDKLREETERAKDYADQKIMEERNAIAAELKKLKDDKEKADKLNAELLMIMKNRANAKRGIQPKKKHDGYVILRSEQYEYHHQKQTLVLWRTTIQTPVDIGIKADEARYVIHDAFVHRIGRKLGVQKLATKKKGLSENISVIDEGDWEKTIYVLDIKYRQNTKTKLWEVVYVHNKAIVIPEDMYMN